jgi:hypothetical protein
MPHEPVEPAIGDQYFVDFGPRIDAELFVCT